MKNSRIEGVLVFDTKKPYTVSINGTFEDRTEIICHDVNAKCESAALDMEQLFLVALNNLPKRDDAKLPKEIEDETLENFFEKESPTLKEVEDQADALEIAIMINNSVKASKITETFNDFIHAGVICSAGDVKMTTVVWNKISIKDRVRIVYMYCAFFVNPLERLSSMDLSTDNQG